MPTITKVGDFQDRSSNFSRRIGQYTGPASYVTGGDPFPPEAIGLGQINALLVGLAWSGSAVRLLVYDPTAKKVVWYVPNTGAEVANAQDLSAFTVRFEAIGK